MPETTKPTIFVVHGAWHVPQHYKPFTDKLSSEGYEVHTPHLPSCGELAGTSTLDSDVEVVREQIKALVDASKEIIMVPHSYGGAVATQALQGDNVSLHDRQQNGLKGGVLHIVYMCGFMLQPGESCFAASQPRPDPDPVEPGVDGTSFLNQPGRDLFYADVKHDLATQSEELLVRHSLAALAGQISYPAWQFIPTTYIACTEDKVLFPEWQQRLIQAVKASGVSIEVETFKASHSPFLSLTSDMVAIVDKVAAIYV